MYTDPDFKALPASAVPAAFDRGHLYSPTLDLTRYALDDRYLYDYRPGDLYEPMPAAPTPPKDFAWWFRNIASEPVPDFLGLRVGDQITIQHVGSVGPGEVIETRRNGAIVRYPYQDPELSGEMYVSRRNNGGHWYP
jgi:hypothetical protein